MKGEGSAKEKTTYLQKLGVQEMKSRSGCPGAAWQLLLGKEGRLEVEWEMRGKVDESAGPRNQAAVG